MSNRGKQTQAKDKPSPKGPMKNTAAAVTTKPTATSKTTGVVSKTTVGLAKKTPTTEKKDDTPRRPNKARRPEELQSSSHKINPASNTNNNAKKQMLMKKPINATKPQNAVINTNKKDGLANKKGIATDKIKSEIKKTATASTSSPQSKAPKATVIKKPNPVLSTFHNVTVSSPPSKRRNAEEEDRNNDDRQQVNLKRERTRTRTLDAEEVVVLRNESAKQRIEAKINSEVARAPPVAFDVVFDDDKTHNAAATTSQQNRSRSKSRNRANEASISNEADATYSDDFESYESDFESSELSGSVSGVVSDDTPDSSTSATTSDGSDESDDNQASESTESDDHHANANNDEPSENINDDEESELTQNPVTVIQRSREQKLDSGNYEMNSRKILKDYPQQQQQQQQQPDSLETSSSVLMSEQMDSGIGNFSAGSVHLADFSFNVLSSYCGYKDFNTKPIFSKRGMELMSKIQFDTLTFTLFDIKPVSYEMYMQTYGKLNTRQSSSQTHENFLSIDCQTEDIDTRSKWTQHPAQYDLGTLQKMQSGISVAVLGNPLTQNCCGDFSVTHDGDDINGVLKKSMLNQTDILDNSLQALQEYRRKGSDRSLDLKLQGIQKPIDFERLHTFLLNSTMLIGRILNANVNQKSRYHNQNDVYASISHGYIHLNASFLNALRVVRIFANAKHNLVITVHESLPEADVYRTDFANLLMVWSTTETEKPIRLLSTWSEVCQAEICNASMDFVVCGLRDGSLALWDMRETHTFCSKLDGSLTHFAATQSIVPIYKVDKDVKFTDLGAVIDVKSFRLATKLSGVEAAYKAPSQGTSIQFVSLNETGVLAVWTLVEYGKSSQSIENAKHKNKQRSNSARIKNTFEYSSPWARAKLVQSAICDLRDYLKSNYAKVPSQFDKTKMLFEKNVYDDEMLRELNDSQSPNAMPLQQQFQGLRFTSIDVSTELIYVCINRNFVLICSKSLKTERFRKITINEDRFLFPTALRVLTNEQFLAVGLSNGAVIILNCDQSKKLSEKPKANNSDKTDIAKSQNNDIMMNLERGKSCAIQNIILNERRNENNWSFDEQQQQQQQQQQEYYSRPTTTSKCIDLIENKKRPFELHIFDQQIILSGSWLRKDLVQDLLLSSDGWRLFSLSNNYIRVYDFYLDKEISLSASGDKDGNARVLDMAVAKTDTNENNLIILNQNNIVEMHYLKQ